MSRLIDPALAIEMDTDSWGRPTRFTLLGRRHKLVRALQHWQVDTDWWHPDGGVHREYWAVTTSGGLLCVVYKELGEVQRASSIRRRGGEEIGGKK